MFLGHGLLAFAVVVLVADASGWSRGRALTAGALAGGFALAPDVDMLYAPVGLLGATGPLDAAAGFWAAGNTVHRAVTHSLVVGSFLSGAVWLWASGARRRRLLAGVVLAGLVAVAFTVSGPVGAVVVAAFCLVATAIAEVGFRRGVSARAIGALALFGLLSHPFGDLLTGEPPAFLYPFDVTLLADRPAVFADPTLNLLAPLFLELATLWLALWAVARVGDRGLRDGLAWRAATGTGFGAVALLLPAPTLDLSYRFVFGLLGVGTLLAAPLPRVDATSLSDLRDHPWRGAVTWLTAVTLAALTYTVVYLVA